MTDNTQKFRALVDEAHPLQTRLAELSAEMVGISAAMTLEIVRQAFPKAKVQRIRAVSEIKPSDYAKSAKEAVGMLREHGIEPTTIIVDEARSIVTLAIQPK